MDSQTKERKHPVLKHPYIGAIALLAHGIVIQQILVLLGSNINDITSFAFGAAAGIIIIVIHCLWFRKEFRGPFKKGVADKKLIIGIALFFVADLVATGVGIYREGFAMIDANTIVLALMAAFGEEAIFRFLPISIMMRSFKDKNKFIPAIILSSVVFSLVHFMNLTEGAGLGLTCLQVFETFFAGIMFSAIYLRTGSLVYGMVIHLIHDIISGFVASQASGVAVGTVGIGVILENVLLSAVMLVVAIVILKGRKEEIMNVWKERWNKQQ